MKKFMDANFMLSNDTAVKLYHNYAKYTPIIDYHCHLSPQMMLEDKPFENISQIFLGGDHYKWRYMRSCGVDEGYITGGKSDYEKFIKFCSVLQYAVGNPLYHWTHLELSRYFGIDDIVSDETADVIWKRANAVIKETSMRPSTLIKASNVEVICTTDDPIDTLEFHAAIVEKKHITAKVLPTFRPDFALNIDKQTYIEYVGKLSEASDKKISSYKEFIGALYERIDFFHSHGCRISDHALDGVPYLQTTESELEAIFQKAIAGEMLSISEAEKYKGKTLVLLGKKYHELNWAMQLHIGALRNNNTKMFAKLGADVGFDSINDYCIAQQLSKLLNAMEENNELPKTILYTLNPKDNYVLATMLGNFQSSEVAGKIQFGSGWWFNDQRDGMIEQMKALGNLGALCIFIGMLTDSRSFLSYTRHEYFRRILCDLIGGWVENGEFTDNEKILGKIIENICYNNAKRYFKF